MLDLHNHSLPAIDDGACDWDESLAMAQLAVDDGIEGIVCTPHWIPGLYDNTRPRVLKLLEVFRQKLHEHGIPLEVYPGAELRLDLDLLPRIRSGELLTINDTGRFALIELPEEIIPMNLESFFQNLQRHDLTPIISHPERNFALQREPMMLYRWVQQGALVQITGASLRGRFGPQLEQFSMLLLKHHLVHIVATDAHSPHLRTPQLSEARQLLEQLVGTDQALHMTYRLPQQIIAGKSVTVPAPEPIAARPATSSWKRVWAFLIGQS